MKLIFERTLPASRVIPGAASWYAIFSAWLFVATLTTALIQKDLHLAALIRVNEGAVLIANRFNDIHNVHATPTVSGASDFVVALPGDVDPDSTIRFTSRLAQDQEVRISQIQSQTIATDAQRLGQAKFTIQLRGDYANIKNVVIGLLAKFPGLTLQRLTIHHRDTANGNGADSGTDEASLELIQFIRPATMP